MKAIVYTPKHNTANEVEDIIYFLDHGADYLYLYKPDLDDFSLVDYVEQFPEKYFSKMISTSLILCKEFDMAGYHFTVESWENNSNYNNKILDWISSKNKISSKTAHTIEEVVEFGRIFNHLIVSPIFYSISKQNYSYPWDFEKLQNELKNLHSISYAVGGIDKSKINIIKDLGFDGYGLLGSIWNVEGSRKDIFDEIIKLNNG